MNFLFDGRVIISVSSKGNDTQFIMANINKGERFNAIVTSALRGTMQDDFGADEYEYYKKALEDAEADVTPCIEISVENNTITVKQPNGKNEYQLDNNSGDSYLYNIVAEDIKNIYTNMKEQCREQDTKSSALSDLEFMLASVHSGRKVAIRSLTEKLNELKLLSLSDNYTIRHNNYELIKFLLNNKRTEYIKSRMMGFYVVETDYLNAIKNNFTKRYKADLAATTTAIIRGSLQQYRCNVMTDKLDSIVNDASEIIKGTVINQYSVLVDGAPVAITADQMLDFIDSIRKDVHSMYSKLAKNPDELKKFALNRANDWKRKKGGLTIYNTSSLTNKLVEDDSWEYKIFELVRFFKTIDFSTETIVFAIRDKVM